MHRTKVKIVEEALDANNTIAQANRGDFDRAGVRDEGERGGLPPLWHVYPESLLAVRHADGRENFLTCCRCGAIGSPALITTV